MAKKPNYLLNPSQDDRMQALFSGLGAAGQGFQNPDPTMPTSFAQSLTRGLSGFNRGFGQQTQINKADQLADMQAQQQQAQIQAQQMKIEQEKERQRNLAQYQNISIDPETMNPQGLSENEAFARAFPDIVAQQKAQALYPSIPTSRQAAGLQYEDRLIEIQKMPETTEKERELKSQAMKGFLTSLKIAKPMDLGGTIGIVSPYGVEELTDKTLPPGKQPANIKAATRAKTTTEQTAKAAGKAFESLDKVRVSIGNMNDALAAIRKGAKTGPIMQYLPSLNRASVELDNVQKRMGLDVIGNVTFGALSKGELDLALSTAIPTALEPKALEQWLITKKSAQEKLAKYLEEAALYLSGDGNTLASWTELQQKNRKLKQNNSTPSNPKMSDDEILKSYGVNPNG